MTLFEYIGKPDYLFDSHCHLNDKTFDIKIGELISEAKQNKVEQIWDISVDIKSSKKSLKLFKNNENIKIFVGIDPEIFIPGSSLYIQSFSEFFVNKLVKELEELVLKNRDLVFGIGEIGLDYYWLNLNKEISEEDKDQSIKMQKQLFEKQILIAEKYNLPVSIHSRSAEKDCLQIVKMYNVNAIFHSYTGDYVTLKNILDSGFNVGINGIITYKNAQEIREMYKKVLGKINSPKDLYKKGVYLETDAPYLSPQSKRGETNNPGNISEIYKFITQNL